MKDTPFDGTIVKAAIDKTHHRSRPRDGEHGSTAGGFTTRRHHRKDQPCLAETEAQIAQVAPSNAPVLIQGETGSGKEIVARMLHAQSGRASRTISCRELRSREQRTLESELFGHEKGAFTGATATKPGLIAAAEGGTLFLDELGEMSGPMQVSLLRFLDRSEYRPVGSTRTLPGRCAYCRSHESGLQELVHRGRFRDDLLYRINTVTLRVPPLHERKEDLPKLAEHILSTLRLSGITKRTISPEGVQALSTHSWPGNVRELRNVLEGIVLMSNRTGPIGPEEVLALLPKTRSSSQTEDQSHLSLEEIERLHIERVLDASGGNKTQAAKTLDIDYKTLLTRLKKYGLAT